MAPRCFWCVKDEKEKVIRWDDWNFISRRVTRGGRGEVSSALFQNLKKSALILGKNALTSFIYGYNFSFKMLFQAYLGKNLRSFSLQGLSFVCCRLNLYRSALIFRDLPSPEKFLVICLIKIYLELQIMQK